MTPTRAMHLTLDLISYPLERACLLAVSSRGVSVEEAESPKWRGQCWILILFKGSG